MIEETIREATRDFWKDANKGLKSWKNINNQSFAKKKQKTKQDDTVCVKPRFNDTLPERA